MERKRKRGVVLQFFSCAHTPEIRRGTTPFALQISVGQNASRLLEYRPLYTVYVYKICRPFFLYLKGFI